MPASHHLALAAAACSGGALLLALIEPWLRLLHPSEYSPSTPPWLAVAAALASSSVPPATDADHALVSLAVLPPPIRAAVAALREAAARGRAEELMGAAARDTLFMLDAEWTYLNHGSYGAALRLAVEAQRYFQDRLEAQPVLFQEEQALGALRQAQLAVAGLVGAEPRDLVFVANATTAINAVLQSTQLGAGDLILLASTTYPAVRSAAARVAAQRGAALLEVDLLDALAGPPGAVLRRFEAALQAGSGRVRLAILDHVISSAPVHLPVAPLAALCRRHGAAVLVDGAHAVGAVPLDIPALGCDYYTSNLHKWACTPKGAAFLWAARSRQRDLLPLVTSHGYGLGFQGEFLWSGTSDWSAVMAVPTALAVLQALEPAASEYRTALLRQAVGLLLAAWGTSGALGVQSPHACMSAVEMPAFGSQPPTPRFASAVQHALRDDHRIEVPVACAGGKLWCRISCQIYNTLADYQKLADSVLQLAASPPGRSTPEARQRSASRLSEASEAE
ncbi:hypothetical protein ABPG77_006349 [Micractinium sp. CCAP 211/92]